MSAVILEMLKLLAIDVLFIGLASLVIVLLAMTKKAAFAVLKRNFVGYFSNPTGYVFLCLFVLLTSIAAFWPHEFFVANLANLDQLNKHIALILLIFIPAITMSIWAEERRQGTDELLLTLPAADFDIVIGKYLAAAAIFTVSLLFSQISNYSVLVTLAWDGTSSAVDIDTGLFFTTYLGYWMMGLAMIAIGMVASFLTNNLTVAFILGLLFNSLLVVTYYATTFVPSAVTAENVARWSFTSRFDDFGRGVLSLSSLAFFGMCIAFGIYLCLILIGKRHWLTQAGETRSSAGVVGGSLITIFGLIVIIIARVIFRLGRVAASGSNTTATILVVAFVVGVLLLVLAFVLLGQYRNFSGMLGHFLVRGIALLCAMIALLFLVQRYDLIRLDTTEGQVSSLSPDTRKLLRGLSAKTPREIELEAELAKAEKGSEKAKTFQRQIEELVAKRTRPLYIDAYISANVPEEFVKLRYNLVSLLNELQSLAGSRVIVRKHFNLEPFSEEAAQAEERFGIRRQRFLSQARGAIKEEEFIMGAAFTSGLEKVVVPAFQLGTPVEYELVRSIATVGAGEQKKLGVVRTDAQLMGGFSFAGMQPRQIPKQQIIDELEKQYKVEEVDPTSPIEVGKYDVLLVVQPSSLGPLELNNVVEAIKQGQPAAIFEDPMPYVMGQVVGTATPKPPAGGGMFGGGQPQPKGDIRALWSALGVSVTGDDSNPREPAPAVIVWQNFNPYPKFQGTAIGPEFVFVRDDAPGAEKCFAPDQPVVAGFEELLLTFPTGISQAIGSKLSFTELVSTSPPISGTLTVDDWQANQFDATLLNAKRVETPKRKHVLAAWIRSADPKSDGAKAGKSSKDTSSKDKSKDKSSSEKVAGGGNGDSPAGTSSAAKPRPVNVIYVADIDLLHSEFVRMRNEPNREVNFRFDNVPFVLNVIDAVAGDHRFLEIRKRKPRHSTLQRIEARASKAREAEDAEKEKFEKEYNDKVKEADEKAKQNYAELQKIVDELRRKQSVGEEVDPVEFQEKVRQLQIKQEIETRRAEVEKQRLQTERDKELARIQRERDQQVQKIQNEYKVQATFLPVIPPLLVGLVVWARRRVREREGVSRERMKTN